MKLKSLIDRSMMVAMTAALAGCQASALPPSPAPLIGLEAPRAAFLTEVRAGQDLGLRAGDFLSVMLGPAPARLPIQYRRSVEEHLVWEGQGEGVAELWNAYGQLVYRVREGEPKQDVTVPAGSYTLEITGARDGELWVSPETLGDGSLYRRFEWASDELAEVPMDQLPAGAYPETPCETLADAYRRLATVECSGSALTYRHARAEVTGLIDRHSSEIEASCPEMLAHAPSKRGNVFMPFRRPARYYCDRQALFSDLNHKYLQQWESRR